MKSPVFWLTALAVVSFLNAFAAHRFQSRVEPDSSSYEDFDWSSTKSVLASERTPGYPLFLRFVGTISTSSRAVPIAHWLALMLACLIFYRGVKLAGLRTSTAIFSAGTLMLSSGVLEFGPVITADALAIALAVASAGCFFGTLGSPVTYASWAGLILTTFATYLTRPAYLFLIPLWPLLSVVLNRLILRREERWRKSTRRGLMHAAACVIPFLAYCLTRLLVVGHFGLVSFGGYNFVGVVGQFLTEDDVPKLSEELRPIAEGMLQRRSEFEGWTPPSDYYAMERMFNNTVWDFAVPSAEEELGESPVAVNATLSQLGWELLLLHRGEYVRWLAWNGWHGVAYIVQLTALDRGVVCLLLLLLAAHLAGLKRGPKSNIERIADHSTASSQRRFVEAHLLLWSAVAFAAAAALLVVLVEVANDRYMTGAMTLLPAAIAIPVSSIVRRVFPAVRVLVRGDDDDL